ncbi:unnamed protein product, partial [Polarella glacialis]
DRAQLRADGRLQLLYHGVAFRSCHGEGVAPELPTECPELEAVPPAPGPALQPRVFRAEAPAGAAT